MQKVKRVMQWVMIVSGFLLVLILGVLCFDWLRLNTLYERIMDRMTVAYVSGDDVEGLRADLAYANATANMKLGDIKSLFLKAVVGTLALVCAYVPVHFFSKAEEEQKVPEPRDMYIPDHVGEKIYDDRDEPKEPEVN